MFSLAKMYEVKYVLCIEIMFNEIEKKNVLPDGESNPGLPRDRRGYLPLYYRG